MKWSWETIMFWTFRVRADVRVRKLWEGFSARAPCSCALIFLRDEVVCGWA